MHPLDAFLQLYARLTLDAQHFGTLSLHLTQCYELYGFGLFLDLSLKSLEGHVQFCTSTEWHENASDLVLYIANIVPNAGFHVIELPRHRLQRDPYLFLGRSLVLGCE